MTWAKPFPGKIQHSTPLARDWCGGSHYPCYELKVNGWLWHTFP